MMVKPDEAQRIISEMERVVALRRVLAGARLVDIEKARAEVIRCAKGLVLTALPTTADEGVVVPEWWNALTNALVQLAVAQDEK